MLRCALALLGHIISLAAIYLTLHAHLLAAIQMLVYAGAVVVLFIFVIMLIGPSALSGSKEPRGQITRTMAAGLMGVFGIAVAGTLVQVQSPYVDIEQCPEADPNCLQFGGVEALADAIYQHAAVPFELLSVLLLVAIIAAIAVARGRTPEEKALLEARRREREAKQADAVESP